MFQVESIEHADGQEQEAGIYMWSIDDDRLYADTAAAALFGLDAELAVLGLPLSRYLAAIHPDDKPDVAAAITKAVKDGLPYSAEYRSRGEYGHFRWVMAAGRCFRKPSGDPAYHAGIVYPLDRLI